MKNIIGVCLLCACVLNTYGEVIAGVAIRVNGHAITLYEIASLQSRLKISKQAAIDMLINERLKDDEIERFKISIEDFKIDEEIALLAANANLSKEEFLRKATHTMSLQEYRSQIKKQLQTKELMQRILASNISISSEDELLSYYTHHKKEFLIPSQVRVVRYFAQSDNALQKAIQSPKQNIRGVQKVNETIALSSLNPQIAQVFMHTPNNEFTPVLTTGGNGFVSFLVKERLGESPINFEEAKPLINQKIMAQKEQSIITEHFNKIRSSANIITLRE
ncbi:peptidyl-prolyl cis-trans isomerase [Helicobacter sp. MIT 21-1697]|uniref:peptidylprolyl isomerase n=1 Tax=Helicobacter sp. MIT 21-1697 TaxID=2993733 RepID=UPI00224B67C7|nr:peptidyl-prolyl cis-trans isomerase [Helicobacter sp. MIT 21-1697]MCX2716165.1 peptidyl-prolyl cis-trans isomerase [Helicobacter sp. MIT 21-1697]